MVLDRLRRGAAGRDPKKIPDGLWVKCPGCSKTVFKRLVEERMDTCPECNHHFPMAARNRIKSLIDDDTWQEFDSDITSADPLHFVDSSPTSSASSSRRPSPGSKTRCCAAPAA